jgi:hypothetical protein
VGLILSETKLQRWRLSSPTPARTGVAIVVQTAAGRTEVLPGQRTAGESMFAPHSTQYEVDTSDQRTRIEMAVNTRNEPYAFQVSVDVAWRVEDAAEVVRRRLNDGSATIGAVVRDRIKELGRRFTIEQTVDFENHLRDEFAGQRSQVGCLRIVLVTPDVTLDPAGAAHLAALRAAEGQTMIIQAEHGNEVLRQRNADEIAAIARQHEMDRERITREYEIETKDREERDRQHRLRFEEERAQREAEYKRRLDAEEAEFQAELQHRNARRQAELADWEARSKMTRELEEAKRRDELHREQNDYDVALRREDQRLEIERAEQRIALFQRAIAHGDPEMVAVHLGMHPEDSKEFIMAVAQDKTATAERQAALLSALIERKLIIPADLEGVTDSLVRAVAGIAPAPEEDRLPLTATVEAEPAEQKTGTNQDV